MYSTELSNFREWWTCVLLYMYLWNILMIVPKKVKKQLLNKFVLFQNVFHKTGYPSSVWYILGNEFCERFSYYGMHGKVKTISKTQTNWKFKHICIAPITEQCKYQIFQNWHENDMYSVWVIKSAIGELYTVHVHRIR